MIFRVYAHDFIYMLYEAASGEVCFSAACFLSSRRGERKTGAQQIFSPAQAVDEFENRAMCAIPNSDVPALLGHQPNTSLAFK